VFDLSAPGSAAVFVDPAGFSDSDSVSDPDFYSYLFYRLFFLFC
jgi:hypothetical protein